MKSNLFLSGGTQLLICRFRELSVSEIHVFWCIYIRFKMLKVKWRYSINEDDSKVLLELSILSVKNKTNNPPFPLSTLNPNKALPSSCRTHLIRKQAGTNLQTFGVAKVHLLVRSSKLYHFPRKTKITIGE